MLKKYNFDYTKNISDIAVDDITKYLKSLKSTLAVIDAQDFEKYRKKDIDIVWDYVDDNNNTQRALIEIKSDSYHDTGNFFFETASNKEKNTPGCFMYTEANYIFYYFHKEKILYSLPMPHVKNWFQSKINKFKEVETKTSVGNDFYTTVGRLVPRDLVEKELNFIQIVQL